MSTLDVTIIQADLIWHDADRNLDAFTQIIRDLDKTDLIVLPEMFTTGFSMDAPTLAEPDNGRSVQWMQALSQETDAAVCGSLIIEDQDQYFNRFYCAMPDGALHRYNKRHLFRLADEQHHYAPGKSFVTFEYKGFRLCPMICYDLRFPVWARNRDDYDVLLFVANWPSRRQHAWDTLLRARAIENLSYVVGVNRVGQDGNDLPYTGGSAIIDYAGTELTDLGNLAGTATAQLNLNDLCQFRKEFAFHKDADEFHITR